MNRNKRQRLKIAAKLEHELAEFERLHNPVSVNLEKVKSYKFRGNEAHLEYWKRRTAM